MLTTGSATTHTYDTTTGAVVINGAAAGTNVYFYPTNPVMGFALYENGPVNNLPAYAWDTQFGYTFDGTEWSRVGTKEWHGDNLDYFYSVNWEGATEVPHLFTTNFYVTNPNAGGTANDDQIQYTNDGATWNNLVPRFQPGGNPSNSGPYVVTAKLIFTFHGRMILLNTIENDGSAGAGVLGGGTNTHYPQRLRYSFRGSPLAANAWYEVNQFDNGAPVLRWGGAGVTDAATKEEIVSAAFIKDRLIVFFDRSTWEIVYTGVPALPFRWQKLNDEFGSLSTGATIQFDRQTFNVSKNGITACNGSNVQRIDNAIEEEVYSWRVKDDAYLRVQGIRDFRDKMTYWTYQPDTAATTTSFATKILAYNYQYGAWSKFDDTVTVWGYFEQQQDLTWQNAQMTWQEADFTWNANVTPAQSRRIIAGNHHGYTFLIEKDFPVNAPVMTISNVSIGAGFITVTAYAHNLQNDDFVEVSSLGGLTPNNDIGQVTVVDANTFTLPLEMTGTYTGGGVIRRLSQMVFRSKAWNPYKDKGRGCHIEKIDFIVAPDSEGAKIRIGYSTNGSDLLLENAADNNKTALGDSFLDLAPYDLVPYEDTQKWLVHPIYIQSDGQFIQIAGYITQEQMLTTDGNTITPVFQGFIIHAQPTSYNMSY